MTIAVSNWRMTLHTMIFLDSHPLRQDSDTIPRSTFSKSGMARETLTKAKFELIKLDYLDNLNEATIMAQLTVCGLHGRWVTRMIGFVD